MQGVIVSCLAHNCEPFGTSQDFPAVAKWASVVLEIDVLVSWWSVDPLKPGSRKI
jgi:hypothetical protein